MTLLSRISQGCNKTNNTQLKPSHQNTRLSSVDTPTSTHQATNELTEMATASA